MFTSSDSLDMIVLKATALHSATQERRRPSATPVAPASLLCPAPAPSQDSYRESAPRIVPTFTFTLPVSIAPSPHGAAGGVGGDDVPGASNTGGGGGVGGAAAAAAAAARMALRDALQSHEDALRVWADEPVSSLPPALLEAMTGVPATATAAAAPPATRGLPSATHCTSSSRGNVVAEAVLPRRGVVATLMQPHCRVLASRSIGATGLPPALQSTRWASHEHGSCATPPVTSSTSSASSSHSPGALDDTETSRRGTPLAPYQLPLRLRPSTPPPPSAHPSGEVSWTDPAHHAFVNAQAARYAQWRSRQAAVLHELAPDMWGRALPYYAALGVEPRVMDVGLRAHASRVRRSQYDNGVVFV